MLKTFYRSLFDTDWLVTQRDRFGRGWLYLFAFTAVMSAISTATLVRSLAPTVAGIKTNIEQTTPEFQAELKNGVLTVNGPQQWEIKKEGIRAVLDVRATSTATIENYRTTSEAVILLTSTTLSVFDNDRGSIEVFPLSAYGEGAWTRADLLGAANWAQTNGLRLVGVILFLVSWLLGTLVKALYAGLVAWVLCLVMRRNPTFTAVWTHRQAWTVGLYASTLPTLIQQIEQWTGFVVPGLYTFILAIIIYLVLRTPVVPAEPANASV